MTIEKIKILFESQFDLVSVIQTADYIEAAQINKRGIPEQDYPTLIVLGYAYPKRIFKHSDTHLIPSFYTFGRDYHSLMKEKIEAICQSIPHATVYGVDNHPLDERLMAELSGVGFKGKNQLIINKQLGSYFFLGYVLLDLSINQTYPLEINDSCGDCHRCIDVCPGHALSENGYDITKCLSAYNQEKKALTLKEIKQNYSLFGCDICQLVCPKNINKGNLIHSEFNLSGKEKVSIRDLFTMSQKEFYNKYSDMAYLWRGKTILMRNASMVLLKRNQTEYIDLIKSSLELFHMPWYKNTTQIILNEFKKIESQ